jgi:hypothetical protein
VKKTIQIATLVSVFASQTLLATAATEPSVHDEQQMTQLGSEILKDADNADQALQKNDGSAADKDINDAMTARAKLAQQAKAGGGSMVVPLYADLDETEYLSAIGKKASANGMSSANAASANSTPSPLTVKTTVGQVTYLAIDLDKTNSRLSAAKTAIQNKNDQAAEDSLAAIGSNLVETSVSTDLPLLTAREDLALARTALNAKNDQAATADLHQASQALATYAASGPHADDAKKLLGEIDTAAGGHRVSPPSVSTQKVDSWWERVKDWFAHPSA